MLGKQLLFVFIIRLVIERSQVGRQEVHLKMKVDFLFYGRNVGSGEVDTYHMFSSKLY